MLKRLICFTTLLSATSVIALQAAPVLSGPITQCSAIPNSFGSPTDLILSYAIFSGPDFACEQQDKIYSNFSVGALPTSSSLRIQLQPIGEVTFHTVTLNGNFGSDFVFSYDIAIDPNFGGLGLNTLARITRVTGDVSNPSHEGSSSNLKSLFTEGGASLGSLTSTIGNPGAAVAVSETALHVVDTYSANGGAAVSVSNTFLQQVPQTAPEPAGYVLIGGGFLLIASLRRFRR